MILNTAFENITQQAVKAAKQLTLCDSWFVKTASGSAELYVVPLDVKKRIGVSLTSGSTGKWFRLLQRVEAKDLPEQSTLQIAVKVRGISVENDTIRLNWIGLLSEDQSVLARKLAGAHPLDPTWRRVRCDVTASDLPVDSVYYVAMEFEGKGTVDIQYVRLEPSRGAAEVKGSPASHHPIIPSAPSPSGQDGVGPRAAILGLEDRTLKLRLTPRDDSNLTILVDGRRVEEGKRSAPLQSHAANPGVELSVELPKSLFTGAERTVTLLGGPEDAQFVEWKSLLFAKPVSQAAKSRPHEQLNRGADVPGQATPTATQRVKSPPAHKAQIHAVRKVAVLSWDMGHNPVGRAFLLADMAAKAYEVELIGPVFPRFGTGLWKPLGKSTMNIRTFPAHDLKSFVEGAKAIAAQTQCDAVYVGKARLPSLLLGILIKHTNGCPMIVDIDDHELSFFPNAQPITLSDFFAAVDAHPSQINEPYSELWTRLCETLVRNSDFITVSNIALQRRFGGMIVRHGRDETVFSPRLYDRRAVRVEFGYTDADRVVVFLGTPRPHKGIFAIADAMEKLNDPRLALCVIGSINDKRVANRFDKYKNARIALHPDQPWDRLPELISMADTVFILQDPASPISEYQIPAKLTDALALGVPVYATPVPPLEDLISAGAMKPAPDQEALENALRRLADDGPEAEAGQKGRQAFLAELSYTVNSSRIVASVHQAQEVNRTEIPEYDQLLSFIEAKTEIALPRFRTGSTARKGRPFRLASRSALLDVVFLWKQNDSDLYGRRSDMMVKYLLKSERVGRILHLDAPINEVDLTKQISRGDEAIAHQGNHVYVNTIKRVLKMADTPNVTRRTFVFRGGKGPEAFLGMNLPNRSEYAEFIEESLREAGIGPNPLLWVSPVVFDYDLVKEVVNPSVVVADIIDDQRSWQSREEYRKRVIQAYEDILGDADLVTCNCEPVRKGFSNLRSDILVVPNGAEEFDPEAAYSRPEEFSDLPRPIIGYVGNLRDRVDLPLIKKVAQANPQASIVLVGSAHGRPEVLDLQVEPNIHLMGVRPYNEALNFIKAFDVAMMPHVANEISENMNPLKLYVYFSLNVPIVTTAVANIGDLSPFINVGETHDDFINELRLVLEGKGKQINPETRSTIMRKVSWKTRVEKILSAL